MHDGPMGGHLAFLRTYLKVKNNHYWPNMRKDIQEYCKACEICIANSKSTLKAYLHPHDLAKAPFQVIGIDFLGPITPESNNGNKHILVMTDYFSRWVVRQSRKKIKKRSRPRNACSRQLLRDTACQKQLYPTAGQTSRHHFFGIFVPNYK
jgi:hypothetical protein